MYLYHFYDLLYVHVINYTTVSEFRLLFLVLSRQKQERFWHHPNPFQPIEQIYNSPNGKGISFWPAEPDIGIFPIGRIVFPQPFYHTLIHGYDVFFPASLNSKEKVPYDIAHKIIFFVFFSHLIIFWQSFFQFLK